jgi:hypothetical protein
VWDKDEFFAREDRQYKFEGADPILERPELVPVGLYGILEQIVDAACERTEAVPTSVAINVLARFAATIGRTAYVQIGDQTRYLNFNALIVGPTAKGRKGTSADMPAKLFRHAELLNGAFTPPLQELTALSTGEGLIHRVRDPRYHDDSGACIDKGVADKRLLCEVSEFGGTLAVATRKENPLTAVIRDAFDNKTLTTPTKTSFNRATGAHIVIVGHITEIELVKLLTENDVGNGLANRFGMFYSARTKLVPDPKPTPQAQMDYFANWIHHAAAQAINTGLVQMDDEAREHWDDTYRTIHSRTHAPKVAKLLERQDVYVRMLSALIALINGETTVRAQHIDAALAWTSYWETTANFIFSTSAKNKSAHAIKEFADRVVDLITTLGGRRVSHSALTKKLTNNYAKRSPVTPELVNAIMDYLQRESPLRIRVEPRDESAKGRPATLYSLVDRED